MPNITQEVAYLALLVALMIVPRVLQRLRLPAPLTCFGLGMGAAVFLGNFGGDATLSLLATLGISSLFLFAGLEVDIDDFGRGKWPLLTHLLLRLAVLGTLVYLAIHFFGFTWQVGALLALSVLTPSTGFILDTLKSLQLSKDEQYWVRMKAISSELLALLVLFVVLQSGSVNTLLWSTALLAAMIVGIPLLFMGLGRVVFPYAQGSEFSLLMMVGIISAFFTYELGVYYLVGAFLAGFIAKLLRKRMPMLASDANLHAIQMFASFFVPFYFFYKGMGVPSGALTLEALALGIGLSACILPVRVGTVWLQRRFIKGESARGSFRVAVALTPTLIFTLVLATVLRERFHIAEQLYGALLVYAGISTMLPMLLMSKPTETGLLPQAPNPDPVSPPV